MTKLRADAVAPIVVVLGGGMLSDTKGGPATTLRARKAVKLAKANPDWTFILSGDGRIDSDRSNLTEAQYMCRILLAAGIDRSRLLLEEESRCTVGNAVLVAARYLRHLQPRTLYVVTSPFHEVRALLLFRSVLGCQWDVRVAVSTPARGDAARRANEPGGIEWTKRFFAGITPGDLRACITKLVTERPHYASSSWLQLDDDPGGGGTTYGAAAA
ncbi:MAG TPA: YdcF family protein [Drouetiella sp.]|jgi:DUF218 domain